MEIPTSRLSKVFVRQTDRQTDRDTTKTITQYTRRFAVEQIIARVCLVMQCNFSFREMA